MEKNYEELTFKTLKMTQETIFQPRISFEVSKFF